MKYSREIKVGIVAIICVFLLIFGFNYLKGVNIFSSVSGYHGRFAAVKGLQEQAAVYVRGFRVGQVDAIHYDFAKDTAFVVDISVARDIKLPYGTRMALVSDGLLGGTAIELRIPVAGPTRTYNRGDFIPTLVVPGLMDEIQDDLLTEISQAVAEAKKLITNINTQLADNHLYNALDNIDSISAELTATSHSLKGLMADRVPAIVDNADSTIANIKLISADIKDAELSKTIAKVDSAVGHINDILAVVKSDTGTLGKLINDSTLYANINTTIVSADSLLTDLKAHPKRYVHFSLFGRKDK